MKTRNERALAFLISLGDTPDAIAAKLKRWGIKGSRRGCDCPIANVLKAKFRGPHKVWVSRGSCTVGYTNFTIPHAVKLFIRNHDSYLYPELQEN